jgi:adenosylcobyric acid synthase
MAAKALMVQGTSSSVGKSLVVTALCRLFARRGVRVAPFKAQNMSNNAAVCPDGAEIGRAQAVQAAAAGLVPTADMNPVLLKPEADSRSQVIVQGRPWQTLSAGNYYRRKEHLWPIITAALDRLRDEYELVLIEGAGSPVELNLRSGDLANMSLARYARSPVLLVGDIDRGGIFAQLLGTVSLLEADEQKLVRGLVVNKFRGDRVLFRDGVRILEERSGLPVLGVVPFLRDFSIPEEDAVALDAARVAHPAKRNIVVIRLPHIANFDDFDPLQAEAHVCLRYADSVAALGRPQAIILPGTKSTLADLDWLHERGLATAIQHLAASGTAVVGICGGYQMLGRKVRDPEGVEAGGGERAGLGLLPVETIFAPTKATFQAEATITSEIGWLRAVSGTILSGYEIHMGRTPSEQPWLTITRRNSERCHHADGALSTDGRVWGCYLHGLFSHDGFRAAWLRSLTAPTGSLSESEYPNVSYELLLRQAFDRWADVLERELDLTRLEQIIAGG